MKKSLFYVFLLSFLLLSNLVWADIVNPEYLTARHCPLGRVEKECSFSRKEPFGPITSTDCGDLTLNGNPKCQYLFGTDSSFGGSYKYCCDVGLILFSLSFLTKNLGLSLLLTLLTEIPIFWIFGFRNKRSLLFVALANVISVIPFSFAGFWLSGLPFVAISELLIIIFESAFLIKTLKNVSSRKIIIATIVANFISATLGSILLNFINSLL